MHSQFPMQPNYFVPGQEYPSTNQGPKDPNLEAMQQQQQLQPNFMNQMPMNPSMPIDNKQLQGQPGFQGTNMPPPSFFQMFNNQLPPAEASKMLMDYIQSQGQNPGLPMSNQGYGMNPSFPMQGQNNYSNMGGGYSQSYNQGDQGKRDFGGGYQNKFRNNNGGGGFRDRSDRNDRGGGDRRDRRDDRGDRGDRGGDRGDRGDSRGGDRGGRGDRGGPGGDRGDNRGDRGGDRRDRGERNDRGDRGERRDFSRGNNQYDSGKGKRMDNFQRDKRSDRRSSRSRSRSFERRDNNRKGGFGNNNFNKDREGGGDRYNKGGNFSKPPFKGGDDSSRNRGGDFNDWKCLGCGNVNWARRDACNRCKAPRTEDSPIVPKDESRGHSYQSKGGFDQKPNQHMGNYKRNDYKNEGYRENSDSRSQNEGGM